MGAFLTGYGAYCRGLGLLLCLGSEVVSFLVLSLNMGLAQVLFLGLTATPICARIICACIEPLPHDGFFFFA